MKIYAIPDEVPFAEPDYRTYDSRKEQAREEEHIKQLKDWLVSQGYEGQNTGEVVRFPVADGYARYMFADAGRKSFLMHLPYGDGYHYRDVEFLPKSEILKRIEQEKGLQKLFGPR